MDGLGLFQVGQLVELSDLYQIHIRIRRQVRRIQHRLAIRRKARMARRVLVVEGAAERQTTDERRRTTYLRSDAQASVEGCQSYP